jgi:hypothetical protein
LQDDYDFIKLTNWKECKDIIDNVKTNWEILVTVG